MKDLFGNELGQENRPSSKEAAVLQVQSHTIWRGRVPYEEKSKKEQENACLQHREYSIIRESKTSLWLINK